MDVAPPFTVEPGTPLAVEPAFWLAFGSPLGVGTTAAVVPLGTGAACAAGDAAGVDEGCA